MVDYIIREIRKTELSILEEMLYLAIYQPDGAAPLSRDIIKMPEINIYIDNFYGKYDDYCLVAEAEGAIVGSVWVRILGDKIKGFGHINKETPEFAISLLKEYRNQGIGTALMKKMIKYLKDKKYKQASLSVCKDNYALALYEKVGFEIIEEKEDEYLMLLNFE